MRNQVLINPMNSPIWFSVRRKLCVLTFWEFQTKKLLQRDQILILLLRIKK